jgi:hypothetical protein
MTKLKAAFRNFAIATKNWEFVLLQFLILLDSNREQLL